MTALRVAVQVNRRVVLGVLLAFSRTPSFAVTNPQMRVLTPVGDCAVRPLNGHDRLAVAITDDQQIRAVVARVHQLAAVHRHIGVAIRIGNRAQKFALILIFFRPILAVPRIIRRLIFRRIVRVACRHFVQKPLCVLLHRHICSLRGIQIALTVVLLAGIRQFSIRCIVRCCNIV